MPELPELEVIKQRLGPNVIGKTIKALSVIKPYVLRSYFDGDLEGQQIESIRRRGKYLVLRLTSYDIYIHLMLHGTVTYVSPSGKTKKSANALLLLKDGATIEFSEKTAKKRMSMYITQKNKALANIANLGVEPLSKEFTVGMFESLVQGDRKQLKRLLCAQSRIAGIGNAYADEILWKAELSPFKISTNMNKRETKSLYDAIISVLNWAIQQVTCAKRLEKRDFLQIHGKKGHPCPRCGDKIRVVSFSQGDTYYCANCQTGGHKLKDRRMSKFYR
jgi:formamidopyrimidine-DNA glycosylase